jgi:predicted N-acyltransferase
VTDAAFTLETVDALSAVDPVEWDACAGSDNPFVGHAFLSALEDSRCVGGRTGWFVHHAILRDPAGRLVAAAPLYAKTHSQGEYVFDHGWADAYAGAGGRYYPKLLSAVPFSPVPGPRLLVRPGAPAGTRDALAAGLIDLAKRAGLSSVHVNFCGAEDWAALAKGGFLQRIGEQFHWENRGYASFEAFLETFASRKRKQVRKERAQALEDGISIHTLTGAEIGKAEWDAFFRFYISTSDRKWGSPYLTRRFFDLLAERLGDRVVLVMARRHGKWIGGALNLRGGDTLYGRNWGCEGDWKFLHFEACYYRAIDYAIAHGLARVEAGAQGTHKIQRGYLPVETYSAHWFADPRLGDAVARFLVRERAAVRAQMAELATLSPYKDETPADA